MVRKIFLVCVIAFSIAVFVLGKGVLHTTDAQRYALLANNLVSGRGYTLNGFPEIIYPPGPSLLIAPLALLGLSLDICLTILMAGGYLLLGLGVFLLAKEFLEGRISFLASLLVLINGNIILWSILGYAEILLFGFLLLAYYFFVRRKSRAYLSGFLAGFAYLLKPEALIYIVLFISAVYLFKRQTFVKNFKGFCAVLLIVILAYASYLYINTGKFAISGKMATLQWDSYIEDKSVMRDSIAYKYNDDGTLGPSIINYSLDKVDLEKRVVLNLVDFKKATFEILLPLKAVLTIILLALLFIPKTRKTFLILLPFVLPVFVSLFFHIEQRYLLPLLLFAILFLSNLSSGLFRLKVSLISHAFSLAGLVVLLAMTYYSYYPLAVEMPNLKREKEETVSFVSSLPETSLILSKKPVYAFFAKTDYYPLPWIETSNEFERYLIKHNGGLIVLDDWSRSTIPTTEVIIKENFADKVPVVEYAK